MSLSIVDEYALDLGRLHFDWQRQIIRSHELQAELVQARTRVVELEQAAAAVAAKSAGVAAKSADDMRATKDEEVLELDLAKVVDERDAARTELAELKASQVRVREQFEAQHLALLAAKERSTGLELEANTQRDRADRAEELALERERLYAELRRGVPGAVNRTQEEPKDP